MRRKGSLRLVSLLIGLTIILGYTSVYLQAMSTVYNNEGLYEHLAGQMEAHKFLQQVRQGPCAEWTRDPDTGEERWINLTPARAEAWELNGRFNEALNSVACPEPTNTRQES